MITDFMPLRTFQLESGRAIALVLPEGEAGHAVDEVGECLSTGWTTEVWFFPLVRGGEAWAHEVAAGMAGRQWVPAAALQVFAWRNQAGAWGLRVSVRTNHLDD